MTHAHTGNKIMKQKEHSLLFKWISLLPSTRVDVSVSDMIDDKSFVTNHTS